jgi:predicted metal-dependent phosphoesterase TrpH
MHFDLHIHSKYSPDCRTPLEEIMKTARKKGLQGLAITDHDSIEGFLKAKPLAKKFNLKLIPGYELKTREGDVLIYGITEVLEPLKPAEESVEIAREMGAVVVAAHPFDPFRQGIGDLVNTVKIHGIEVSNSHCINNKSAKKAAIRTGLAQVGGSDAHISGDIGNAYTLCNDEPLTAIKTRKCSAFGGLNIKNLPVLMINSALTILKKEGRE